MSARGSLSPGLVALAISFLLSGVAFAQNWPQFRGPQASGMGSGDPPITWNVATGENVKWKTPIRGVAHASPVVWGEKVFLANAFPRRGEADVQTGWLNGTGDSAADSGPWTWQVICLDIETGRELWSRTAHTGVPKAMRHVKATHANCTPATDGKHVVAFFGSEGLFCFTTDGEPKWQVDLGVFKSGPFNGDTLEWGFASSPIIYGDQVIVQCDSSNASFWAAFDIETGRELRRVKRREVGSAWSTPAVFDFGGSPMLVCNGWQHIAGYDLTSGEELWHLGGAGGDVPVPTPLSSHGLILMTAGHGRSHVFAVRPDARGDLTPHGDITPEGIAWWQPKLGSYMPTPIVVGDHLFVPNDNGVVTCLDARTGALKYRERLPDAGTFSGSAVAAGDRIYFVNEDGDAFVFRAGEVFDLLARNALDESCLTTPAIADGKLLIRTGGQLICLGR